MHQEATFFSGEECILASSSVGPKQIIHWFISLAIFPGEVVVATSLEGHTRPLYPQSQTAASPGGPPDVPTPTVR